MMTIRLNALFAPLFALLPTLLLSGCLYLADTQQGNVIEPDKLAQVEVGQNQEQVRFLLGTPVVQDPLHPERWDYVFYFEDGETGETVAERVTIVFDRGIVRQIARGNEPIAYFPKKRRKDAQNVQNDPQLVDLPLTYENELKSVDDNTDY